MDMITSGYNFEGYKIVEYCGHCTGEAVLGTGFLSSLEASISDILGTTSDLYAEKLNTAKEIAMSALEKKVKSKGANAIIGLDIDFTVFGNDIMGVIANGTAVVIAKEHESMLEEVAVIPVVNYNTEISLCPIVVKLLKSDSKAYTILEFAKYDIDDISAAQFNLNIKTVFGDVITINSLYITNFIIQENKIITSPIEIEMGCKNQLLFTEARIEIVRFLENNIVKTPNQNYKDIIFTDNIEKLRENYGYDVVTEYSENDMSWTCVCGKENTNLKIACDRCKRKKTNLSKGDIDVDYINKLLCAMKSIKEVQEYISSHDILPQDLRKEELDREIESLLRIERLYGNQMPQFGKAFKKIYLRDSE